MSPVCFEDIPLNEPVRSRAYVLEKDEVMAFARAWDPLPVHVDEAAARASIFGGITAAGCHLICVKQKLVHEVLGGVAVMGSFGYDEVRFITAARPGDALSLSLEWLEKRESRSKPDRGIAILRLSLLNQNDEVVLTHLDTVMVKKRAG